MTARERPLDVLVIGSSPLLLAEAALRGENGERVTVLDSGPIGGAWWVDSRWGITGIETACHVFESDPIAHGIMEHRLGIPLQVMDPQPTTRMGTSRVVVSYGSRSAALVSSMLLLPAFAKWAIQETRSGGARAMVDASPAELGRRVRFLAAEWKPRKGTSHMYPVGGSAGMVQALRARCSRAGVQFVGGRAERIELSTNSTCRVTVTPAGADRTFDATETFTRTVDRAVIGSGFVGNVAGPTSGTGDLIARADVRTHHHKVLLVRSAGPSLSYERWIGSGSVLRVSDVTQYTAGPRPPGTRILCVNTRSDLAIDDVVSQLMATGVVSAREDVADFVSHTYESSDRSAEFEAISQRSECLDVVRTYGDLTRCVSGSASPTIARGTLAETLNVPKKDPMDSHDLSR